MVDIKKPIRILHVLPGLTYCGGIEAYLLNYYRHIDRSKIQFDFITHSRVEHEIKSEIESLGGRVFDWETFRIDRVHTYEEDKMNPLTELSSIDDINYTLRSADAAYNSWSKNIKQNIIRNADYFASLETYDIKEVYSFGFSYNDIDMPYIKIIIDGLRNPYNVKWIFSDYNEDDNQKCEKILRNNDFKGTFARFHSSDD